MTLSAQGPAAMGVNGGVNGGHEARRCGQGGAEAAVVVKVGKGKPVPLAIFEPLLGRGVATDGEGPGFRRYTVEALFGVNPHLAGMVILWWPIGDVLNTVVTRVGERGHILSFLLQKVKRHQLLTQANKLCKQGGAADQGQDRKIRFQVVLVALPIGGAVENGIDAVQHVLRTKAGYQVPWAVRNKLQIEGCRAGIDKAWVEVMFSG